MSRPHGVQWIVELYGCRADLLERVPYVERALSSSAERARAAVIRNSYHQFEPYGVSGVTILRQSHVTIHTWPEDGYGAVDFFFCHEDMDVDAAIEELKRWFGPSRIAVDRLLRGPHQGRGTVTEPGTGQTGSYGSLQPDEPG